jgi:NAD(P)-dependent dehydrogenase (short-subunit alcohol dehydrogenase family)
MEDLGVPLDGVLDGTGLSDADLALDAMAQVGVDPLARMRAFNTARPRLANPERRSWIEARIKLGRTGTLENMMGPVLFLASDASALVTGMALLADGGWTAD